MSIIKNPVAEKNYGKVIIDDDIKSHADDPFVLKKVEAAKRSLSRPGIQEQLKKIAEKQ